MGDENFAGAFSGINDIAHSLAIVGIFLFVAIGLIIYYLLSKKRK